METVKLLALNGDILDFKLDKDASPSIKIGSLVKEEDLTKLFVLANNGIEGEVLVLSTDIGIRGVLVETLIDALKENDIDILDYPIGALLEMGLANMRTINTILTSGVKSNFKVHRRALAGCLSYSI